jgi:phosphatidylserine decarboxylase
MGLIRFGSRVEILVPGNARVVVRKGDRVRGGSTVVAWFT